MNLQKTSEESPLSFRSLPDPTLTQVQSSLLSTAVESFDILATAIQVAGIEPDQSTPANPQVRGKKRKFSTTLEDSVEQVFDDGATLKRPRYEIGTCIYNTEPMSLHVPGCGNGFARNHHCKLESCYGCSEATEISECVTDTQSFGNQLDIPFHLAGEEMSVYNFKEEIGNVWNQLELPLSLTGTDSSTSLTGLQNWLSSKEMAYIDIYSELRSPQYQPESSRDMTAQVVPQSYVESTNLQLSTYQQSNDQDYFPVVDYESTCDEGNNKWLYDGFIKEIMRHRLTVSSTTVDDFSDQYRKDEGPDLYRFYDEDQVSPTVPVPHCAGKCPCNGYKSYRLKKLQRKSGFRAITPLYKKMLKRRLLKTSNVSKFRCCAHACNLTWYTKRLSKFAVVRDYEESDLHVYRFRWGQWKPTSLEF